MCVPRLLVPSITPGLYLLSNGHYHLTVTTAGGGYSWWNALALTRWNEDTGSRGGGLHCYMTEPGHGELRSAVSRPQGQVPRWLPESACERDASFSPGLAVLGVSALGIDIRTEVLVAPEDDVELGRRRITNQFARRRTLSLTSYAEIVLEAPSADSAHPAFEKLFIESALIGPAQTLVCSRRPSAPDEAAPSMFHLLVAPGAFGFTQETDCMRFIGRGRCADDPKALDGDAALSGTVGTVLDPVMATRYGDTLYQIEVHRSSGDVPGSKGSIDWDTCPAPAITLGDDRRADVVCVRLHAKGA